MQSFINVTYRALNGVRRITDDANLGHNVNLARGRSNVTQQLWSRGRVHVKNGNLIGRLEFETEVLRHW